MKKSEIQIFLAHASEDKPAVLALYNRLKQAGYNPKQIAPLFSTVKTGAFDNVILPEEFYKYI